MVSSWYWRSARPNPGRTRLLWGSTCLVRQAVTLTDRATAGCPTFRANRLQDSVTVTSDHVCGDQSAPRRTDGLGPDPQPQRRPFLACGSHGYHGPGRRFAEGGKALSPGGTVSGGDGLDDAGNPIPESELQLLGPRQEAMLADLAAEGSGPPTVVVSQTMYCCLQTSTSGRQLAVRDPAGWPAEPRARALQSMTAAGVVVVVLSGDTHLPALVRYAEGPVHFSGPAGAATFVRSFAPVATPSKPGAGTSTRLAQEQTRCRAGPMFCPSTTPDRVPRTSPHVARV